MNPRSTDYEADALTTTPSRRLRFFFGLSHCLTVMLLIHSLNLAVIFHSFHENFKGRLDNTFSNCLCAPGFCYYLRYLIKCCQTTFNCLSFFRYDDRVLCWSKFFLKIFKISSGSVHFIGMFFQMLCKPGWFHWFIGKRIVTNKTHWEFLIMRLSAKPKAKYSSIYCLHFFLLAIRRGIELYITTTLITVS